MCASLICLEDTISLLSSKLSAWVPEPWGGELIKASHLVLSVPKSYTLYTLLSNVSRVNPHLPQEESSLMRAE